MKRVLIALLAAVLLLCSCAAPEPAPPAPTGTTELIRLQEEITDTLLPAETPLDLLLCREVTLRAVHQSDSTVSLVISAPNISDALMDWVLSIQDEDYSDDAFMEQIDKLLQQAAPEISRFEVEMENGAPRYSAELLNTVHCGMDEFFLELQLQALRELGGEEP